MSVFDYVKSINEGKRIELGTDYSQWVINDIFSQYSDCLLIVNQINRKDISDRMHYDYMLASIRPKKRPFLKPLGKKRTPADVSLIANVYKYSICKAREALSVLTDEQLAEIKRDLFLEA